MPGSHADIRGPFVGRRAQLDALDDALSEPALVTLLGPGGVGKTRLAREVVRRHNELAVVLVWLDELESDDEVAPHVARALGIASTDDDVVDRVVECCAQAGPTLLVMDNAEHVIDGARELIERLPMGQTRILVTSREPLELPGERRISLDELAPDDALELFLGRLSMAGIERPEVDLAPLLRALDHLPLAIELAAPRLAIMSSEQILQCLQDSNEIVGSAGASRHGTLDRTIGWSWDLLTEAERDIAYTVARFEQPVAPELVVGCWPEHDVYSIAQSLQSKSWLRTVDVGSAKRWTTLWAMRRFVETSVDDDDRADFAARLTEWARANLDKPSTWWAAHVPAALEAAASMTAEGQLAEAALLRTRSYYGAFGGPHFSRALEEGVSLLEAWDPTVDRTTWSELASRVAKGFFRQARAHSAIEWSERAFATAPPNSDTRFGAGAQFVLCLMDAGRRDEAEPLLEALDADRKSLRHDVSLSSALLDLATSAHEMGRFELTRAICNDVLTAAENEEAPNVAARTWIHLAYASYDLGDYERARFEVDQLGLLIGEREVEERLAIGGALPALVELQLGEPQAAHESLLMRAEHARQTRYHAMEFFSHLGLVEWAARHDPTQTEGYLRRALVLARTSGSAKSLAHVGWVEAVEAVVAGRYDSAMARIDVLRTGPEPGDRRPWLNALDGLRWFCAAMMGVEPGDVASVRGQLFEAAYQAIVAQDAGVLESFLADHSPSNWNVPGVYTLRLEDVARRLVRQLSEAPVGPRLELDRDGRRFRLGTEEFTDISRRGALRRILVRLAEARVSSPGVPLSTDDVITAGWPDEEVLYEAALSRVYTTMKRLRALGFQQWIRTLDEGYALDPALRVEWVD